MKPVGRSNPFENSDMWAVNTSQYVLGIVTHREMRLVLCCPEAVLFQLWHRINIRFDREVGDVIDFYPAVIGMAVQK